MEPITTIEQVEVLLSNLIGLRDTHTDNFTIDHDDVVVTLQKAIELLRIAYSELYSIEVNRVSGTVSRLSQKATDAAKLRRT